MGEIAKPSDDWALGHYVDKATKFFAESQFLPDATCSEEIVHKAHAHKLC